MLGKNRIVMPLICQRHNSWLLFASINGKINKIMIGSRFAGNMESFKGMRMYMKSAYLVLENGQVFEGYPMGDFHETVCEIVFNTSMTGYVEILSDPSYAGQGVVMSYPMIGNYGLNYAQMESRKPHLSAFIVRSLSEIASNATSEVEINEFLKKNHIPCLAGVDTRAIIRQIREHGAMNGAVTENRDFDPETIRAYRAEDMVEKVTRKHSLSIGKGYRVAMLDYGAKAHIAEYLVQAGCEVTLYPADTPAQAIIDAKPDGIMLSNGPGDPKDCGYIIEQVKILCGYKIPIFAICLGHQLIALALGGDTFKLKYGHRGANHPVKELATGRVRVTSQNHSYAVDGEKLPEGAEISYINVTDKTVEGLSYPGRNIMTVQFHPEAAAGPWDTKSLFQQFVDMMQSSKNQ